MGTERSGSPLRPPRLSKLRGVLRNPVVYLTPTQKPFRNQLLANARASLIMKKVIAIIPIIVRGTPDTMTPHAQVCACICLEARKHRLWRGTLA